MLLLSMKRYVHTDTAENKCPSMEERGKSSNLYFKKLKESTK
jgi:hypothetical protein